MSTTESPLISPSQATASLRNPRDWKRNVTKEKRNKREAYISFHSGKLVPAKKPGILLNLAHDRALKVAVQNSFACNNNLRGSL